MGQATKNPTRVSGTKEWSKHSVNCVTGCSHDCRYCYARDMAVRFKRIRSAADWATMKVRSDEVHKRRRRLDGRIMFPTTHDITPETLEPCLIVLRSLLNAGNDVLIVSKPHLSCIGEICWSLRHHAARILFRFSIGARDDRILRLWEPGAPPYCERRECLALAHEKGFATSVSAEPLLDPSDAVGLYDDLAPLVTDTIWFGKLNQIRRRAIGVSEEEIRRIEHGQTPEAIRAVYDALKDRPKVRWKESYKEALGLALADEAGLDV